MPLERYRSCGSRHRMVAGPASGDFAEYRLEARDIRQAGSQIDDGRQCTAARRPARTAVPPLADGRDRPAHSAGDAWRPILRRAVPGHARARQSGRAVAARQHPAQPYWHIPSANGWLTWEARRLQFSPDRWGFRTGCCRRLRLPLSDVATALKHLERSEVLRDAFGGL